MARENIIRDDLTGEILDEQDAVAWVFEFEGVKYELDVSEKSKAEAIKGIRGILGERTPSQELMDNGQRQTVADWINKNVEKAVVSSRGRIKQSYLDEFDKAHAK